MALAALSVAARGLAHGKGQLAGLAATSMQRALGENAFGTFMPCGCGTNACGCGAARKLSILADAQGSSCCGRKQCTCAGGLRSMSVLAEAAQAAPAASANTTPSCGCGGCSVRGIKTGAAALADPDPTAYPRNVRCLVCGPAIINVDNQIWGFYMAGTMPFPFCRTPACTAAQRRYVFP